MSSAASIFAWTGSGWTDHQPYRVVARDPNPAARNDSVTHPHVQDEMLCEGDGRSAIRAALAQGRIFDFFLLVSQVLHTYARGSAYVEMDDWSGVSCSDCGTTMSPDDSYCCQRCGSELCGDCRRSCAGCEESHCSGCLSQCPECEMDFCRGCLEVCPGCNAESLQRVHGGRPVPVGVRQNNPKKKKKSMTMTTIHPSNRQKSF